MFTELPFSFIKMCDYISVYVCLITTTTKASSSKISGSWHTLNQSKHENLLVICIREITLRSKTELLMVH